MRVVLDTSVLIDALMKPNSSSFTAFREVKRNRVQMITSPSILGELQGVLQTSRFHQPEMRAWLIANGVANMPSVIVVVPRDVPNVVPGDALDDHVVAAAVEGKAELIVSTDHHLLDLKEYKGIKIVHPDEFLVILGIAKSAPSHRDVPDSGHDGLAA